MLLRQFLRDPARRDRLDGRVIDINESIVRAFDNSVFAQDNQFHIGRIGQVGKDHIHLFGDFPGRACCRRAFRRKLVHSRA